MSSFIGKLLTGLGSFLSTPPQSESPATSMSAVVPIPDVSDNEVVAIEDGLIDLTKDSPVSQSASARSASLRVWRERHRQRAATQAGASTSDGSVRRSNRGTGEELDVSLEIIDVDDNPGPNRRKGKSSGTQEPHSKRRRKQASQNDEEKQTPAPVPEAPIVYRCPVCLDSNKELKERNESLMCLTCGHMLCKPCSVAVTGECPVCRKKIKKNGMHPLFL